MSVLDVGTQHAKARLVHGEQYYDVARTLIARAHNTCLVSLFIVELKSSQSDAEHKVFELLKFLVEAVWRGVQVKLILGGSRSNLLIAESAEFARYVSLSLGVPCKWLTSEDVRGSHAKLVIVDNKVLTGSHNWSAGAFSGQTQDSVLIESAALAAYLRPYFDRQWHRVT